jgi:hypothetical protein
MHTYGVLQEMMSDKSSKIVSLEEPTQLPPEEGPFKFEADKYTRKQ